VRRLQFNSKCAPSQIHFRKKTGFIHHPGMNYAWDLLLNLFKVHGDADVLGFEL
jgi:hypothetical protein